MEFGRTDTAALNAINFTLPPEPSGNKTVLPGTLATAPKVYLGCPTWGSKHWAGKLYPAAAKEKQFSVYYPQHFNSIELNATHYKIYEPSFVTRWKEKAEGHNFLFCPKMYNGITHDGSLNNKAQLLNQYMESIAHLQPYLGPVFIQLSDSFNTFRKQELFSFLETLPESHSFFLELRHTNWFGNPVIRNELFGLLKQLNIGVVITDTPARRDCAHMELTVPKTFIRYVGNNLHPTDDLRVNQWAERIKYWLQQGITEVYFFCHMPEEKCCPELIARLAEQLNTACGLSLPIPQLRDNPATKMVQGSMFD